MSVLTVQDMGLYATFKLIGREVGEYTTLVQIKTTTKQNER